MKTFFKKYWIIISAHVMAAYACYAYLWHRHVTPKHVLYYLVYVAISTLFLFLHYRELKLTQRKIITDEGNKLAIKGLFKHIEIEKASIENFAIKTNFAALVFDWSQVVINTKTETIKIYTRKIKDVNVSFT